MLNNFIYAKKKSLFLNELEAGNVLDEAIVFIEDTREIWNHGTYFDGSKVDLSNIEASILNIIDSYATKAEIPTKISQLENDANYILDNVISDGVYAVNANGKLIDYNTADVTALGVALVAGEHKFMIAKSDATDGTNTTLYWGKNLYQKDVAGITNISSGSGYIGEGKTYGTDFTTWSTGPVVDFNGAANTAAIIAGYAEHGVSMDARDMCTVLNTFNTSGSYNDWYVPACGQLALMYLAKTDINAALAKIGGTALESLHYWSSSGRFANFAWFVGFDDGNVNNIDKNNGSHCRVRFVRDISVKTLKEKVSEIESSVSELLFNVYTKEEIDEMFILSKYEFVDLGLPSGLKWATCNIGATKPEDFGLYFAWGETQGYSGITDERQFSWADYKLCGGSYSTLTKYNNNSSYGTVDTLITLEQVDDAAYTSDNTCRMPTKADLEELTANTALTWETLNGVNGMRFTSKTNGNSIFVPATGGCNDGSADYVGSYGGLWSSSLYESSPRDGWCLNFSSDRVGMYNFDRYYGLTVRAVQEPNTNNKFNPSETVSKVSKLESKIGDINTILESIING